MGKVCNSMFCTGWQHMLLGLDTGCASSCVGHGGFKLYGCYICCEGWLVPWVNESGCCSGGGNGNVVCCGTK